jgi:[FeFe] hydrogenase H-cluster maturation GTPase HydF
LIDTAGFDDEGYLGEMRVEKTKVAMEKTDVAIIVCCEHDIEKELEWVAEFKTRKAPVVMVINKIDQLSDVEGLQAKIQQATGEEPVKISAITKHGIEKIREEIIRKLPEDYDAKSITGDLVKEGDTVLLVMPQDIQAPKGRLILPQMQTLRELLDKKCIVLSCTTDKLHEALESFSKPPKLIITDSQVFPYVYENKPKESMLTSFSVLFASHKGDIDYFVKSATALELLNEQSKVLIAEACTHVPLTEDIGREKLPRMLRKKVGEALTIINVSGNDFPKDLSEYDLVIQCGACMFNRKYVMSRVELAKSQQVPMTNYGVTIAYLTNILDKITIV